MKYIIKLPRNIEVDIFNLPNNFKEIIEKSFSEYTEGTAKDYRYADKLHYIDCMISKLTNNQDASEKIDNLVQERFEYEWKENERILFEDDVYCKEFMECCYEAGRNDTRLYQHFGTDDHHIYDQLQKVIVKVITIVMNYKEPED